LDGRNGVKRSTPSTHFRRYSSGHGPGQVSRYRPAGFIGLSGFFGSHTWPGPTVSRAGQPRPPAAQADEFQPAWLEKTHPFINECDFVNYRVWTGGLPARARIIWSESPGSQHQAGLHSRPSARAKGCGVLLLNIVVTVS
jgi:hypothetical protein